MSQLTTGIVDPNMRIGDEHTVLSFEDLDGTVHVKDEIRLVTPAGAEGVGQVVEVDPSEDLILVKLDWDQLT